MISVIIILTILFNISLFGFIIYFRKFNKIKEEYELFNQINIGDYVSCETSLTNTNTNTNTKFILYFSGKVIQLREDKSIKVKYDDFYTSTVSALSLKSEFPYFMEQWISDDKYKKIYKSDPRSEKLKAILKSI